MLTKEGFRVDQSLENYISMFEDIYEPIQNVERDFNQVLARLLESIAECSQYVNKSNFNGLADKLPKVFAWYCSLVVKSGISNKLSNALWRKFPKCCPYCMSAPCTCAKGRKSLIDNSAKLEIRAKNKDDEMPVKLDEWQEMFEDIYPRDQWYDPKIIFSHLIEELGEASEAYRIRYFSPTALESELADIFTWIIGMANLLNSHARNDGISGKNLYSLAEHTFKKYNGHCPDCSRIPCSCVSKYGNQRISELNVIYPAEILKAIEKSNININDNIKSIFQLPDAQEFIYDIKKQLGGSEITEIRVKNLVEKLILEPQKKKWYENITAAGMGESAIVTLITVMLQSVFM